MSRVMNTVPNDIRPSCLKGAENEYVTSVKSPASCIQGQITQAQHVVAPRTQHLPVSVVKTMADKGLLNYLHHKVSYIFMKLCEY